MGLEAKIQLRLIIIDRIFKKTVNFRTFSNKITKQINIDKNISIDRILSTTSNRVLVIKLM